jgi:hypothetical protein
MKMAQRTRRNLGIGFALGILLALAWTWALAAQPEPPVHIAPPVRGPDDYTFTPLPPPEPRIAPAAVTLKAVAIVGEVGDATPIYKQDMDRAVAALQSHGVVVEKFYYGERSFTWADIVTAATGAHFLLYMGHGVWWGGPCTQPTLVGGFYLGPGQFVHPDRIRSDLNSRMAPGATVIFSHACFSAGQTGCDPSGSPSQDEAARRVQMYAAPFVDIGLKAYFANNYFQSAENYVNQILADPATRKTMGDIFKSVYPNNPSKFRDLSYPASGYDMWLNGETGAWHHAFVGVPSYRFTADLCELAPLPEVLTFTYSLATGALRPPSRTVTPTALYCPLTWTAVRSGNWLTITPTSGRTPTDSIRIQPLTTTLSGYAVGRYTGTITVTVTDPPGTVNGIQRVTVTVDVGQPRLGDLPSVLTFTYFISDGMLLPPAHTLDLRNVGSDDVLAWTAVRSGTWFTFTPVSGMTPQTLWITPTGLSIITPVTLTGRLTVTVVSPTGTLSPVQSTSLALRVVSGASWRAYLPCVLRH